MSSIELAKKIRLSSLGMVYKAKASHIGGALSMTDILAVIYNDFLRFDPKNPSLATRDRCILSKGHACVSFYATLAHVGYFNIEDLDNYGVDGSRFLSHTSHYVPGVELSAGSLGHSLPVSCGIALAALKKGLDYNTYVVLGDGEMDEGSNWEAILFAAHHKLHNLCMIIDYNKIQSFGNTNDVMRLESLTEKLEAFNCHVIEIDGHNHHEIKASLNSFVNEKEKPTVIIAHTIKGKGVSFMENELLWHYKSPSEEQYNEAIKEVIG